MARGDLMLLALAAAAAWLLWGRRAPAGGPSVASTEGVGADGKGVFGAPPARQDSWTENVSSALGVVREAADAWTTVSGLW